ncbi:IS110 family transposase [Cardinium endosymbiont of Philonthus spinipes]|uniref:IS110 family transposase n=1 Tax=Cardinium endosymbiont of Philonthus spinipes TaxID=3077941 RepID=UPI00313EDA1D
MQKGKKRESLHIIHPNAAGIDIGSEIHYVCVPEGRCEQRVQKFKCFTEDLHNLAKWLQACEVTTVAMESTGVYWIPLFQILDSYGFSVLLVNAKHVKNVPGRKSDVQDCQWLQQLHSYGLLQGSFRPDDEICVLRSYIRQRESLVKTAAIHINRMQKALSQMNLQLHKVIRDITGVTGIRIIESILSGERNAAKLASLKDCRIKSDEATIAKALTGDYRAEHLFSLRQEHRLYLIYQEAIAECDKAIADYYKQFETKSDSGPPCIKSKATSTKNKPQFGLHEELYRVTGVDFTTIPGLSTLTVQTIVSEVGMNPHKWPTDKHFSSWLGLSPSNRITGEKVISTRTRKVINRAANAFRMAAQAALNSKSALGAYGRRMKTRLGAPKAITATARKIASTFYNMLKFGKGYVDKGIEHYEKKYKERTLKYLITKAKELGYVMVDQTETCT